MKNLEEERGDRALSSCDRKLAKRTEGNLGGRLVKNNVMKEKKKEKTLEYAGGGES